MRKGMGVRLLGLIVVSLAIAGPVWARNTSDGPTTVEVDKQKSVPLVEQPLVSAPVTPTGESLSSSDAGGTGEGTGGAASSGTETAVEVLGLLALAAGAAAAAGETKAEQKSLRVRNGQLAEFDPAADPTLADLAAPRQPSATQRIGENLLLVFPDGSWKIEDPNGLALATSDDNSGGGMSGVPIGKFEHSCYWLVNRGVGIGVGLVVQPVRLLQRLGPIGGVAGAFLSGFLSKWVPVPQEGTTWYQAWLVADVSAMEHPRGVADTAVTYSIIEFAVDRNGHLAQQATAKQRVFPMSHETCVIEGLCTPTEEEGGGPQ